jgi:hypothetical protein
MHSIRPCSCIHVAYTFLRTALSPDLRQPPPNRGLLLQRLDAMRKLIGSILVSTACKGK